MQQWIQSCCCCCCCCCCCVSHSGNDESPVMRADGNVVQGSSPAVQLQAPRRHLAVVVARSQYAACHRRQFLEITVGNDFNLRNPTPCFPFFILVFSPHPSFPFSPFLPFTCKFSYRDCKKNCNRSSAYQ